MTQVLNLSDYYLILSDEHSRIVICSSSQASPPACAPPASDRTDTARLADRDLQTLRAAQLPLCRRNWAWPQAISFHNQSNRRAPARRLRAECAHAEVCEFLANFRKLREMLNEVCAINAELLRRR